MSNGVEMCVWEIRRGTVRNYIRNIYVNTRDHLEGEHAQPPTVKRKEAEK